MQVIIEDVDIPGVGVHEIRQTINIRVTAEEARRKVNRWVLDTVSYMMHAEQPVLVVNGAGYWRVPVVLTASHIGTVGQVGAVDVNVTTGEMDVSDECKAEIVTRATEYVKHYPPFKPTATVPERYLSKNVPSVHVVELPVSELSEARLSDTLQPEH